MKTPNEIIKEIFKKYGMGWGNQDNETIRCLMDETAKQMQQSFIEMIDELKKDIFKYIEEDLVFYEGEDKALQNELKDDLEFFIKKEINKLKQKLTEAEDE